MDSRYDQGNEKPSDHDSRHITLSSRKGLVTELERIGTNDGREERFILRCHKTSDTSCSVVSAGAPSGQVSWTGFRFHESHWSLIKRTFPQNAS